MSYRCIRCNRSRADWEAAGGMTGCRASVGGEHEWRIAESSGPAIACDKPPPGWRCTRGWHADGPCAAVPIDAIEMIGTPAEPCRGCGAFRNTIDATGFCIACRAVKAMLSDDEPARRAYVGNITFEQFVGGLERSAANIATIGVGSDSNAFDGDLYEEHKDQLEWLLKQSAIKLRDGAQLRELARGLLGSLPRCDQHPDVPATKANNRGGERCCDECGDGIDDYPRAGWIRKLTAYLLEKT